MAMTIVYDAVLLRPACVLLQAAMGGSQDAARAFSSEHWLIEPTPDMKLYPVADALQLAQLVKITEFAAQAAKASAPSKRTLQRGK